VLAAASAAMQPLARADEPLFGFVYTTDLLPKGEKELEQWLTWRHGKSRGKFDVWEERTEFSYGVTDQFQLSGYANFAQSRAYHDGVDGATVPPEAFAERRVDPNERWKASKFVGLSLEGIYRLLSPYKDPIGLALYMEPTVGKGLRELESKVIVQKNFLDDQLVFAANLTVAQEKRRLPADPDADPGTVEATKHWDRETDVNLGIGVSYRFAPNWSAGLEFLNEREFSSFKIRDQYRTNSAYYFGPNLHYGGKDFFFTATFLEQLRGARDYANPPPGFIVGGRTYADDFERYRLRFKAGIFF
jgi:hypothetical protein